MKIKKNKEVNNDNNTPPKRSLLMEGIFLHVLSDLYGSVAAIISGIVIYYTHWYYIDPILSISIVFLIIKSTWLVIKGTSNILLESTPHNINPATIKENLEKNIDNVLNVHHIHLWMLNEEENIITLHCVLKPHSNINKTINEVKKYLEKHYQILHSTIQIEIQGRKELNNCDQEELIKNKN